MSPKLHEFVVVLQRDGPKTPWGIRLVGGSDLDTPLIITKVQMGSPAHGELLRGDIITKIQEYDGRDLRHEDAQMLFRNAGNEIKVVVHRDNKIAGQSLSNGSSRCSSTIPPLSPVNTLSPIPQQNLPYRVASPMPPGADGYKARIQSPYETLPHTAFPSVNESGGYEAPNRPSSTTCFSPQPTRDYQHETEEETAAILNQPYRTTPLILPGAKVKKDNATTECYLRHHPNPQMRAGPQHDYHDVLMKQKVADTVLHRVVGGDESNKVVHKQFNSPIGLYSDSNIERTIHQTVPSSVPSNGSILERPRPSKINRYKKTIKYDPSKSETYRAIHEEHMGDYVHEIPHPVQTKVFHPNRLIPAKKPNPSYPPPNPQYNVNALGEANETIHQSGSFRRLMYSVLGETQY